MQQHKEIKYISDYYITIQKYPDRKQFHIEVKATASTQHTVVVLHSASILWRFLFLLILRVQLTEPDVTGRKVFL